MISELIPKLSTCLAICATYDFSHMRARCLPILLLITAFTALAQTRIDLAGRWERRIGGQPHDSVLVPSSYRPVGTATLRRSFDLAAAPDNRRVILHFEGVAHQAQVRVNEASIGTMGPWTPYDFDITSKIKQGSNQLDVDVTDWQVPLGPSGAWEATGGIIRDVYVDLRPDPYIENTHFHYKLDDTFATARISLDTYIRATKPGKNQVLAELSRNGVAIGQSSRAVDLTAGATKVTLEWDLQAPALWSPASPILYDLRVSLSGAADPDAFRDQVGFRSLEIRGVQFALNGQNLVLRGVCRHDLWQNQGHTLTQAQIDTDLSMIKAMGANFVRLVHYPHDRRVIRAANRIGLLVTEESGLVWLDFRKISRETLETGIGNLERVIHRDWNCPALFAVLLANESAPTLEAIQEARKRVRAIDPELLMSSARIDGPDRDLASSKRLFDEGGLDFYTDHKYGYDMNMFAQSVEGYAGKPVVFTEWGGRAIGQSPVLMKETTDRIGQLVEQGRLAGYSFWSWADLPEFSRQDEEMEGGILKSGVVTEDRTPRGDVYLALSSLYRRMPRSETAQPRTPELQVLTPLISPLSAGSKFTPISLQPFLDSPAQSQAWSELASLMQRFWNTQRFTHDHWKATGGKLTLWSGSKIQVGLFPFETPIREGLAQPLVLTPGNRRLEIPVALDATRLHFLGNITLPDGYPILGRLGDRVGRYVIEYKDGERQEVPLRWGQELARSNMISLATRIDPTTAAGERALLYQKDPVREVHQARLLSVPTRNKPIAKIICELDPASAEGAATPASMHHAEGTKPGVAEQSLVLFAITAESSR
jgi:hypothetical protein